MQVYTGPGLHQYMPEMEEKHLNTDTRIRYEVTIYRGLRIGRDGHLDQSEAYDIS